MAHAHGEFDADIRNTFLRVSQKEVDPRVVSVEFQPSVDKTEEIHLDIGAKMLLHELEQADIKIASDQLLTFVKEDITAHDGSALAGYLEIGRAAWLENRSLPLKSRKAPSEWKWVSFENVERIGIVLRISGRAISIH